MHFVHSHLMYTTPYTAPCTCMCWSWHGRVWDRYGTRSVPVSSYPARNLTSRGPYGPSTGISYTTCNVVSCQATDRHHVAPTCTDPSFALIRRIDRHKLHVISGSLLAMGYRCLEAYRGPYATYRLGRHGLASPDQPGGLDAAVGPGLASVPQSDR